MTVPTDLQSGQRVHKPFKFTVALNKAVPLMYNALASGEMLPTMILKWYRTSVEGKQEPTLAKNQCSAKSGIFVC